MVLEKTNSKTEYFWSSLMWLTYLCSKVALISTELYFCCLPNFWLRGFRLRDRTSAHDLKKWPPMSKDAGLCSLIFTGVIGNVAHFVQRIKVSETSDGRLRGLIPIFRCTLQYKLIFSRSFFSSTQMLPSLMGWNCNILRIPRIFHAHVRLISAT